MGAALSLWGARLANTSQTKAHSAGSCATVILMTNSLAPLRMALVAFIATIAIFAAFAAPAMANDPNPAGTHPVPACGKRLLENNKHCTAPTTVGEITLVTSPAPCTVLIEGTNLASFDQILLDFNSIIVNEAGFLAYLAVYPPGDSRNLLSTSVTVNVDGSVTIVNSSICGKTLITTSALFQGSTSGSAFYEEIIVQA